MPPRRSLTTLSASSPSSRSAVPRGEAGVSSQPVARCGQLSRRLCGARSGTRRQWPAPSVGHSAPSASLPTARCGRAGAGTLSLTRARQELGLTPREFELCLDLGEVNATPYGPEGRRRVAVAEVRRLCAETEYPEGIRKRLSLVQATDGAALLGVSRSRFTRLARAGLFSPVRFTVSRYHQLVWHYLALELSQFAERQSALLHGPMPSEVRSMIKEGEDWRPRLWRSRRMGQLLRQTSEPWSAAAVHACVLDEATLEEAVPDPEERVTLAELRPTLAPRPLSVQARRHCGDLLVADVGEETRWHRLGLTLAVGAARAAGSAESARPAPRPR